MCHENERGWENGQGGGGVTDGWRPAMAMAMEKQRNEHTMWKMKRERERESEKEKQRTRNGVRRTRSSHCCNKPVWVDDGACLI